MAKQGKVSKLKSKLGIVSTIAVVAVLALVLAFTGVFSVGDTQENVAKTVVENIAGDCNTAPTLTSTAVNSFAKGTVVSTATDFVVNGQFFDAAPTFSEGDVVSVLFNQSSYIDVWSEQIVLGCGANKLSIEIDDYSAPTLEIKEDNTVITDSLTGASNVSTIPAGTSEVLTLSVLGTDKKSTGDLVYVIELKEIANVSVVTLTDSAGTLLEEVNVPDFYTQTLLSPYVIAYKIPAVNGGVQNIYTMNIAAKSGKVIAGPVYTTAYVGQAFTDLDGTPITWGTVKNDGSTTAYEATFDYDFYIDA